VQKGDTLWSLAREQLGCGAAWPQLASANPEIRKLNRLQIGTKVKIPARAAAVCSADQLIAPRK
jgi:nucleoid-associated protein YgaU